MKNNGCLLTMSRQSNLVLASQHGLLRVGRYTVNLRLPRAAEIMNNENNFKQAQSDFLSFSFDPF